MTTNHLLLASSLLSALVALPLLAADIPATDPANSEKDPFAETPIKIEALATQAASPQTATPSAIISLPPEKKDSPALTTVKVAQSGDLFWYLPLYVAIDQGLFEKEGLEIALINTDDDAKTVDAVMKGDVQFGIADPTFAASGRSHGQKEHIIANMVNGAAFFGVALNPKVAPIGNPKQLKNYSVATTPETTTGYALQKRMFEDGRLKPNIHAGQPTNPWTDIEAGHSDIALVSEPNVSIALQKGGRIVYSMPDFYGDFALVGALVADETIQKSPDLAQKFVSAIAEAQRQIYADPDLAVSVAVKRFPTISKEVASTAIQNMLKNKTVPSSPVITAEAWKNACQLRSKDGSLGSMDHIMDLVENKFALKAVVQTTP